MNAYEVVCTYGTFYIRADYYSLVANRYQFWMKKKIIVQYPETEVIAINIQNVTANSF